MMKSALVVRTLLHLTVPRFEKRARRRLSPRPHPDLRCTLHLIHSKRHFFVYEQEGGGHGDRPGLVHLPVRGCGWPYQNHERQVGEVMISLWTAATFSSLSCHQKSAAAAVVTSTILPLIQKGPDVSSCRANGLCNGLCSTMRVSLPSQSSPHDGQGRLVQRHDGHGHHRRRHS